MANKKNDKKNRYVTRTFTTPDGKRKYVYGKTKAEAEAKLAELKAQADAGVNLDDDTTFGELAKLWLEQYKAPTVKGSTACGIRSRINAQIMPYWATIRVKDITPCMVQQLLAPLIKQGYSDTRGVLRIIRDIMNLGIDRGCIAKSPVPNLLRAPKQPKAKEKIILPRELDTSLREALPPLSDERMFFCLALYTGMRRNEIMALRWDCIDLDLGVISVRRSLTQDIDGRYHLADTLKSEDGRRDLPIPAPLADELQSWLDAFGTDKNPHCERSGGLLFSKPDGSSCTNADSSRAARRIQKACRRFDANVAMSFTPHILRHTYITRLFEAGLDLKEIQTLAGHADVQITLKTYTHFDKARRQGATFAAVRAVYQDSPSNIIAFPGVGLAEVSCR